MRRHRVAAAVLLAAGALLLAPAAGRAQVGGRPDSARSLGTYGNYGDYGFYGPAALSWPGAFSYTQRNMWYGYNWPYRGYYPHHYEARPYFPSGGPATPDTSIRTPRTEPTSYYDYGSVSGEQGRTARVKVMLPNADARVWFEGQLTRQGGTQRGFVSPQLEPGREYEYAVRARWTENGREVERSRTVRVRADGVATVDFTRQ